MSRRLTEKNRKRLAAETGLCAAPWGGRLSIALVYPNTYHQGMSNLGFQLVYEWFNRRPDTRCERFFFPDTEDLDEYRNGSTTLLSLETQRQLTDFDLVAFSISFENDYLNLPELFSFANLPLWRTERGEHFPLLLCGGVCAFLNPEPLAEIMDLFAVGEAEVLLPDMTETLTVQSDVGREELLLDLAGQPGIYVPQFYHPRYGDAGVLAGIAASEVVPLPVKRQWLDSLEHARTRTCVSTPDTEFASMNLLEISRGCPRGCRFCAAGFIYLPFREYSVPQLERQLSEFGAEQSKVGLVGAAVSDSVAFAGLGQKILAAGGELSVSSVRVDSIDAEQVRLLAESGHKTLALAPEAGSQKMRDVINKGVDDDQILKAVELVATAGIPNLKLYFMVGLPGETDEDVEAICALTMKIRGLWESIGRQRGRLGRLTLSVNPFVPKPFTPLQWAPMAPRRALEKKYRLLQRRIRPLPNVDLNLESLKQAELQAFLARGDRRVGRTLPALGQGTSLRQACREAGLDLKFFLSRERPVDEPFPWEVIDPGVARSYLWDEYQMALEGKVGQPCFHGCRRCGICS